LGENGFRYASQLVKLLARQRVDYQSADRFYMSGALATTFA
jgi:hypothetical protein